MPLVIKTYLKEIPNKGIGLMCDEKINKGQLVYKDDLNFDRLIPKKEVDLMPEAQRLFIEDHCSYWKKHDSYYLCVDNAKYWNHSKTPNTIYKPNSGEVFALKNIEIGEELTSNYSEFCDECKAGNFGFEIID